MTDGSWKTHGREYVYRSPWFDFRLDNVELPNGERIEYGVFEGRGICQVLAVTPEEKVVFVRQWRQPLSGFVLSLPGGMVEVGETPEEAAGRELREETGYVAEGLERAFRVHASPGRTDEVCSIFTCRVSGRGASGPDGTEFIEVIELTREEARDAVSAGGITEATTVLALVWFDRGLELSSGRT
ncbi:NUDIX hydrolase [Rubrobacter indicoceani]|uniref:NUDIX hydrolase n=1 Tax=Rubrobacter indicoceani TaxID=2051957 RepID=UPI000E5A6FB0|nr:NUDIX hydrolase [Rubrobacter indicoceani]